MPDMPLYAEDSYLREFDARVIRSGPKFVVLDQTAFYPEGGGQSSDTGALISGDSTVRVVKAMKRGRDIFHYLDGNIPMGAEVHGVVDWENRLWNMRRHSAEHLLTGLFEAEGEGPKVYSDLERLEYKPSELDEEIVERVKKRFNEIIGEDEPLRIYFTDRESLDVGDDARKASFLEKIPLNIQELRMVEIGGYALTFCFGTHVKSTGDIGRLRRLEMERKKKGRRVVHFDLER